MLKTLALVLLVANALLLAALSGLFDPVAGSGVGGGGGAGAQREPERLQRQHRPEVVRILPPQAASAALAAAAASAAASANLGADGSAAAVACLAAGPFSAEDAATAERSLRDAGLAAGSWQAQRSDDPGAFLIYMGRYADRETRQRKLEQVQRLKVEPADDLADLPELLPGISLGRFDNQAAADAALAQLVQRGVRTARVVTLRQAQSQTLLRVPAADAALRARLAGLALPSGPGFLPCGESGAAASAPAAAPAAPPAASAAATARAAAPVRASAPLSAPASAPQPLWPSAAQAARASAPAASR